MGKHGDPKIIRKHIESAKQTSPGNTIEEIADELNITYTKARNYYRGFPSSGAYTKELVRLQEACCKALREKIREIPPLGYPMLPPKLGKSVVIKFQEKYIPVSIRKRDLETQLFKSLDLLGLKDYMGSRILLHYKDGKFSFRTKDIKARAYINAYAEIVLGRET